MNREMYENLCKQIPNFDNLYVEEVDIDNIVLDQHNSQIRKNGAVVAKVPGMITDIDLNGQQVPACGVLKASGEVELKDGITRYEAQKQRGDKLRVSTYHDKLGNMDRDKWEFHQVQCNDHEVSTPNTRDDVKYQIKKFLANGSLNRRLGYKYLVNPSSFIKDSARFLKGSLYKRSPLSESSISNMIKGIINKSTLVSSNYENYTKPKAFEFYESHNNHGWKGKSAGTIEAGTCTYAFTGTGDEKDILGNGFRKSYDNSGVDINIIAWVSDLADKNDNGLHEARKKMYNIFMKGVDHPLLASGKQMFENIYFLPQIKQGNDKENLNKLYTAEELGLTE